ncbi:formate dehydrogenase subunit delta [Leisingera methylohalidivorans DSM 14336]|uniref:Formate dehydrogenase subunit delta n=2 Tax=Leisingera methylohalidivorans TaxID=133924 RepID=V9VXW2_9RHOB|nr:formate dehydrogenase subunit delta [Leisingera methylohalidivorans]AHD02215.1 formate dehydrogenase subunit delta [Leisingera methylohalidivorans DSM 14336]
MSPEKMVMMANQLASFLKTQTGGGQAEEVAADINDCCEPRMRSQLIRYAAMGEPGLHPLVQRAMRSVRAPADG